MIIGLTSILQMAGLFFQSSVGKEVTEDVKKKLNKFRRPWYLSRRFVGVAIAVIAQIASALLAGLDITDVQIVQITDYVIQGLDFLSVYGGGLSLFGFTNREKKQLG